MNTQSCIFCFRNEDQCCVCRKQRIHIQYRRWSTKVKKNSSTQKLQSTNNFNIICNIEGRRQKRYSLNGRAIKAPPLELNGRWNPGKKGSKKSYFFLNGQALYSSPPFLMARPLREELFLAASLNLLHFLISIGNSYIMCAFLTLEA